VTDAWTWAGVVSGTAAFIAVLAVLAIFVLRKRWQSYAWDQYFKGKREGAAEERGRHVPETHMIKVTVPTFGKPELKVYHPADFVEPLQCADPDCEQDLQEGDDYYEIPISNAPVGSAVAVHLRCERKNQYGKRVKDGAEADHS
jgi:hypothetical protein